MTMDARKQRVLQAIVALYGLEGEPVGSSVLANYFDMAVSSATLRNEMAALTKLGLLEQPHTSAGRVPSAKGYRYYLDNLLTDDQPLDRVTRARVDAVFASLDHEPEKLAEHLGKLESSGQLLLGIINNILDMSRIESGKTTLHVEKMNLPQQISQLDSIIRQQAGQRSQSFTVSTNLQHENVLADPNRLNQVLMNILSNAVKYTPTGGHIRLEVEELPRNEHYARYRFVVQDDGIGMSADYQKTLFDPFTREERSGTNKVQGTGLGMAITKSVIDLMGGSISVESATGKGTRFEVVLEFPIDAEADTVQEAQVLPEEEETASPLSGMKFLCAEDNAINAEILQMLLETKGASCTICPNGQEIVDAFASVKPGEYDMILMDVQMPVMNGYDAARAIRRSLHKQAGTIPIIAMTANAFSEDIRHYLTAGMNAHISKPVDMMLLEKTIRSIKSGGGSETQADKE